MHLTICSTRGQIVVGSKSQVLQSVNENQSAQAGQGSNAVRDTANF
ncbi:MAG: hypothetical protein V7L09_20075 [Nostoc sp.]